MMDELMDQQTALDAEIIAEIKQLVGEDRLIDAIKKLSAIEECQSEAVLLRRQLSQISRQERQNTITREAVSAERSRIAAAILQCVEPEKYKSIGLDNYVDETETPVVSTIEGRLRTITLKNALAPFLKDFFGGKGRLSRLYQILSAVAVLIILSLLVFILVAVARREWVRRITGTELVLIVGGLATIGVDDPAAKPDERRRQVTLLPFRMEKYEVSRRQYNACAEFGPCSPPRLAALLTDETQHHYPIVQVTARQANTYCAWLGRRLPTTVEWARATQGARGWLWPWGNALLPVEGFEFPLELAPVDSESETTTPEPEKIYHLTDNISEWVFRVPANCNDANCQEGAIDAITIIGGAYDRNIDYVTQLTEYYSPDITDESIGFRCVDS